VGPGRDGADAESGLNPSPTPARPRMRAAARLREEEADERAPLVSGRGRRRAQVGLAGPSAGWAVAAKGGEAARGGKLREREQTSRTGLSAERKSGLLGWSKGVWVAGCG
jgi:hypothetical protein